MPRSLALLAAAALLAGCGSHPAARRVQLHATPPVNVSNAVGAQSETSVAVDPRRPEVLVAGSNEAEQPAERVYSSTDGGVHWSSHVGPPLATGAACASDPSVAIDGNGRQYFAFLGVDPCTYQGSSALFVATRAGANDAWRTLPAGVALPPGTNDDKPALAVDSVAGSPHANRLYLAWSRLGPGPQQSLLLAYSDDHGASWSSPAVVNDTPGIPIDVSVAPDNHGGVYVVWLDEDKVTVQIDHSADGHRFRADQPVPTETYSNDRGCAAPGVSIPAQSRRCVSAIPTVVVDGSRRRFRDRVYVVYASESYRTKQDVYVVAYSRDLRPLLGFPNPLRVAAGEPAEGVDRFLPAATVDRDTGALVVCFYDTQGDPGRHLTNYSCAISRDGARTWSKPVHANRDFSNETLHMSAASQYGDYSGVAAAAGFAHPVWTQSRTNALAEEVYTATLAERAMR